MKSVFMASVAVATLIAAPAFAQDTVAYAGLSFQAKQTDNSYNDIEENITAVEGAVSTPIFGNWTVAANLEAKYVDSNWYSSESELQGTVALTKLIGTYRVGGLYAATEAFGETMSTFGVVADKYFDRATVGGAVTYSSIYGYDIWGVEADAAYYPMPALRLNAGVRYQDNEARWGYGSESVTGTVGAEYQIASSPYTVYGNYAYTDNNSYAMDFDSFKVGVRYNFGGTLQSRDQAGIRVQKGTYLPTFMLD